jgi:S1-C subfamily serine protease
MRPKTGYRATAHPRRTPPPPELIESEVRGRLAANGFGDVGVSVDPSGRAYINGNAADFRQKQEIERIARDVAGVRSVVSSLDVPKGWMGVTVRSGAGGAIVQYVMRGAPADDAGIALNDVIVAIDGDPVRDYADFHRVIETKVVGQTITVTLQRGAQTMNVAVRLRKKPFRTG